MKELYWLTRLDSINNASTIFAVLSGAIIVMCMIIYFCNKYDLIERGYDSSAKWVKLFRNYAIVFAIVFFVSLSINIFVPTTKEAYMIYGVGGTIDFIRTDSTAVQLPHKVIDALDGWVDTITFDNDKSSRH